MNSWNKIIKLPFLIFMFLIITSEPFFIKDSLFINKAWALEPELQTLLNLINNYRTTNNLQTLTASPILTTAAEWMANDMATNNYIDHTDSLGRDPFERMSDFGYTYNTYKGENLAAGPSDPQEILELWQNSAGHNAILLDPNFLAAGLGRAYNSNSYYSWYWAADFGGVVDPTDTTPPTVSITSPQEGAEVSGTITISAIASDNVGVTGVKFYRDDINFIGEDTTSPYFINWDTTTVSDGSYTIKTKAYDGTGNSANSSPITITVSNVPFDTVPPTVSLEIPGAPGPLCCTIALKADASDNIAVVKVEFWLNSATLLATDIISPPYYTATSYYSWDTTTVSNGPHAIKVIVYDEANNRSSDQITITINNAETTSPSPSSYLLVKIIDQPRVYEIIDGKKHWIVNPETFDSYGFDWNSIKIVSREKLDSYPRVKLVKLATSPKVYYITESGMKRWIPSIEIFVSYRNKWEDILVINSIELDSYADNILVHLDPDPKVYKLEGTVKRWVKSAETFNRLGFDWQKIAPVNLIEFNYYQEGVVIE